MDHIAREYHLLQKQKEFLLNKYGDLSKFDDSFLVHKMQNIHQTIVHLRYLLSLEKQQLEREKFATESILSLQQLYGRTPFYFSPSYPPQHSTYYPLNIDWSNYVVTPNYEYQFWSDPLYKSPFESTEEVTSSKDDESQTTVNTKGSTYETVGLYKGHLDDVERMCNDELRKVENKINHLRKLRKAWNTDEADGIILPRKLKQRDIKRTKSNDYV